METPNNSKFAIPIPTCQESGFGTQIRKSAIENKQIRGFILINGEAPSNRFFKLQRSETFVALEQLLPQAASQRDLCCFGATSPTSCSAARHYTGIWFGFAEPFGFGFAEPFGVRCPAPMSFLFVIGYKCCGALRLKSVSF